MARRAFFSFHYERDIWRASQVRNSWVTQDREDAGFFDTGLWEEAKKKGEEAIKKLILRGLENTSVTAVLIGAETSTRPYVMFEIKESYKRGNGLLGVYIHRMKDQNGETDVGGQNPFENLYLTKPDGSKVYFSSLYPTYDWVRDDGYANFGTWVEKAAKAAGR